MKMSVKSSKWGAYKMEKVKVFNLSDLKPQIGMKCFVGEKEIGVFLLDDGEVKAVYNRCPHQQGTLSEGTVSGHYVFCSLHERKISLEDGVVQPPDSDGCVETYKTEVENGEVFVWI